MSNLVASLPSPEENDNNSLLTRKRARQNVFTLKPRIEKFDPVFMHELIDLSECLSLGFASNNRTATTTISSTTKKLTKAWKKLASRIINKSNSPKLAQALKKSFKEAAIISGLQDHTLKSIDSIKDKHNSSNHKTPNIKDSVRCTTKLSESFETKEELLESIKLSLEIIKNDKRFDNCLFIDRKFKIKSNFYCDLSFYFLISVGNKLKIVEIQVLTQDYFDEKAVETEIYKEAKKICANINLGYRKGLDTDLFYTYFRSLYDNYGKVIFMPENRTKLRSKIVEFLADFVKNSESLVDGVFLKKSKVPKFDILNPSNDLIDDIERLSELFIKSVFCYSHTKPLIKSTEDLQWLNKVTESMIEIPTMLDTSENPKNGNLNNFLTDETIDLFKQKLENIFKLEI